MARCVYYDGTAWHGDIESGRVGSGRVAWDVVQAHFFPLLLPVWSYLELSLEFRRKSTKFYYTAPTRLMSRRAT